MTIRLNTIVHDGPATETPLLIAHGLFGSARNWTAISRRLAQDRTVMALDMRNHGDSAHSNDHSYAALATDLAQIIGGTTGSADVLGHSMGGKAAMILALRQPALVRRLIVADIAPVAYAHSHAATIQAMKSLDLAIVTRRADADSQLAASIPDAALRAFLLQSVEFRPEGARWKFGLAEIEANMGAITGFPDVAGWFPGPVLFLKGGNSDYVKPEHRDRIKALFPAVQFQVIEGAGHWLHAEKQAEFCAAVAAFLQS